MSPAEAKLEAIRGVLEELLTSSGSGDPKAFAFQAIGQISAILDMEPMEVLDKLVEQDRRRNKACPHGYGLREGPCPVCDAAP